MPVCMTGHSLQWMIFVLPLCHDRCCSALVLRPWFASDVCNNSTLLSRLCNSDSESGQQACEWRHSTIMALWATLQYIVGLPDDAAEARYKGQLSGAVQQR